MENPDFRRPVMSRSRKLYIMAMDVHSDISDTKIFVAQGAGN